ncbi:22cac260-2880-4d69-860c-fa03f49277cb-CDS [Sclerotinia trifoliorum]|uniref:22cac260-2880-4d69-860c-fa03f49277cb-CDS n=1 Tax=Sclerotinia trifoliorum TaxID=28548 RepID=A0A8H2VSZ2_9HELO|nr:22cac260-2880-4d69-860c-fa03f49277cb-CDS [Sclerotinia trifoliorum]
MNIHHSCEDDCEENQPISMVVYPLIEAFGRAPTGPEEVWKYFHEPKIWSKLEVWLDIPEPGEPEKKKPLSPNGCTPQKLVKPYIDEFSNKIKPLVEGLLKEIMQLEDKCDEKDLSIRLWQAKAEDMQEERDQWSIQKEAMSLEIKHLGSKLVLRDMGQKGNDT